ncbi:MAG: selenide, water dikinase SelD [Myxococcales bacterium]|nr:selenide, water dikinase SelD [Myxococcales bacterium]
MVQALKHLVPRTHPWIDERPGPLDDAAVVRPPGALRSLVLTIDVITPIVDDPRAFGAIAAANALSDVWAMGGRPEVALSFIGLPNDKLGLEVLAEVMAGLDEACARARCAIVGGHTLHDTEPKCGLSVVGSVDPAHLWSQRAARPGDVLVLTKAIGTGLLAQAARADRADPAAFAEATAQMLALNDVACEVGLELGAHAATDVTGFGLLGHLRHLIEAARVGARLRAADVPLLPTALELAAEDCVPGGTRKNLVYAGAVTRFAPELGEPMRLALADAQTSGGLLLCLPAEVAARAVDTLRARGCARSAVVGELVALAPDEAPHIEVG